MLIKFEKPIYKIMELLEATPENIKKAAGLLKKGKLVAFPTETVYGLGANGLNPLAVTKIFEAKNRPSFNPLILHIAGKSDLTKLTSTTDEIIEKLTGKFWPGPLTLVLPKKNIVPDIVTAGNPTVAVRMPGHPVALKLIELSGTPIAAPSANLFGQLSPTTAGHVVKQLGNKVDLILDGGKCKVGVESTIIGFVDGEIVLLRPGGIPVEEIEKITGKIKKFSPEDTDSNPLSPGRLPFHYSPAIPIRFFDEKIEKEITGKKVGALLFKKSHTGTNFNKVIYLSENGDLHEAAANLFYALHELETADLDLIYVEPVPEKGLGIAIMDRLKKAVKKYT